MAELFVLLIGIIASVVMAMIKVIFLVTSWGWLTCLLPLGIALVLICLMNGIDFWD